MLIKSAFKKIMHAKNLSTGKKIKELGDTINIFFLLI